MEIRVDGDWIMADGYFVAKLDDRAPATVMDGFKNRFIIDEMSEAFIEAVHASVDENLGDLLPKLLEMLLERAKSKNTKDMIVSVFEEFCA